MSIENRLRQDARKYKDIQPPADLRARMSSALDSQPVTRIRPWKRWLAPIAVAALLALTILPFARGGLGDEFSALLNHKPPVEADTASDDAEGAIPDLAFHLSEEGVRTTSSGYVSDASFAQTLAQIKRHFDAVETISTEEGLEVFQAVSGEKTYTITVQQQGEKVNITIVD